MAPLCAEFGISRKTGYKIFDRYKDCGVSAFSDRSRRPYRQANRLPPPIEAVIVRLKREYPGWGERFAKSCASNSRGLRPESVTYVFGMNCYPCVRNVAIGPRWREAKARPDPDFRYFSKRRASRSLENSIVTTKDHGRFAIV
jgi:hypothetical protein